MNKTLCILGFSVAFGVIGCGPSRPPTYTVTGTVTYQGDPVADGDILFEPEDSALRNEGGKIKGGTYNLKANPGKNKVSIRAAKPNPAKLDMTGKPVPEDYIPEHYNSTTILQETVAPNDDNRFNFALTEKLEKK